MHTCAEIPRTARADLVVRLHNWAASKKGGIIRSVKNAPTVVKEKFAAHVKGLLNVGLVSDS